jgi:hypothetical protein
MSTETNYSNLCPLFTCKSQVKFFGIIALAFTHYDLKLTWQVAPYPLMGQLSFGAT